MNPRGNEQNLCSPEFKKDRIEGKSFTSMTLSNMVRKFIPMRQGMKIPDTKAAVDKEWKMLDTIPAWYLEKKQEQKEGYSSGSKRQHES